MKMFENVGNMTGKAKNNASAKGVLILTAKEISQQASTPVSSGKCRSNISAY